MVDCHILTTLRPLLKALKISMGATCIPDANYCCETISSHLQPPPPEKIALARVPRSAVDLLSGCAKVWNGLQAAWEDTFGIFSRLGLERNCSAAEAENWCFGLPREQNWDQIWFVFIPRGNCRILWVWCLRHFWTRLLNTSPVNTAWSGNHFLLLVQTVRYFLL